MDQDKETMTIEIMANGPLIVKGVKSLHNSRGQELDVREKMALCRCGASKNKPYCDGSHKEIDFRDEAN